MLKRKKKIHRIAGLFIQYTAHYTRRRAISSTFCFLCFCVYVSLLHLHVLLFVSHNTYHIHTRITSFIRSAIYFLLGFELGNSNLSFCNAWFCRRFLGSELFSTNINMVYIFLNEISLQYAYLHICRYFLHFFFLFKQIPKRLCIEYVSG